jgi:hypothetical protein
MAWRGSERGLQNEAKGEPAIKEDQKGPKKRVCSGQERSLVELRGVKRGEKGKKRQRSLTPPKRVQRRRRKG